MCLGVDDPSLSNAQSKQSYPTTIRDILPAQFGDGGDFQPIYGWNIRSILPIISTNTWGRMSRLLLCAYTFAYLVTDSMNPTARCPYPYVEEALQELKTELNNFDTIAKVIECVKRRECELASRHEVCLQRFPAD